MSRRRSPKAPGATVAIRPSPGEPIVRTSSDESGHFRLDNIPAGTDVPLIISIGKWRRRVTIPNVTSCTDNPLTSAQTSLPKNHLEGDLPRIAIATGGCDALECLVRRLGVSDGEFGTAGGNERIHLYSGTGGANQLANSMPMATATSLWGSVDNLKKYDQVLMSCECSQDATHKPQAAMDAMKAYADLGGRVFGSHYHNVWIGGESGSTTHVPAVWKAIATWGDGFTSPTSDTIDTVNNPKGMAFATWMLNVGGSTVTGQIPIQSGTGRQTCNTMDNAKAERWVFNDTGGTQYPQMFQFTTPNEMPKEMRCGKVVFSDMHVAGDSFSSGTFPSGCSVSPLSGQEKALAFMLFDIASCVNPIF
ncbi:MAG: Tryptophan synthase alpha chain [Myxococcales bacterium]|nr:Tryptophan synthase alpha chain [Myxococcales bacterium]